MLKEIDPVVSETLNQALDSKNISIKQAVELLLTRGTEMIMTTMVADRLRRNKVGDRVTFVINRNINFTNVCIKRCGFCAYSRDFRNEEGYFLPITEVVRRAAEAWKFGATEICIQAGLPPKMDGLLYVDICRAIKKELPDIHIHAFSPEEIMYGCARSGLSVKDYLSLLKEAGWFTEFVPLGFVHREAPMYNHNLVKGISPGPTGHDVIKMHAVSRIMLNNFIDNIQVSWVKEGAKMSQLLLEAGVNDFGGTLINESISTSAGSEYGQIMKPKEIRSLIVSAGRVPAQRNSVYGIVKVFDESANGNESLLDTAEVSKFGSYHELIKLDKFRYNHTK